MHAAEVLIDWPVPRWLQAARPVEPLSVGPVSDSWRLDAGGRDVVLRRDRPLARLLGLDRHREAAAQAIAHRAGLAAPVLHRDAEHGVLVTGWIDIEAAGLPAPSPDCWRRVGELLAEVHRTEAPGVADLDLAATARRYAEVANRPEALVLAGAVAKGADALSAHGSVCLCHNDAHLGNVVGERLLDWEYAAIGHPLFDLSVVVGFHDLDAAATRALVRGWGGAVPGIDPSLLPAFVELYHDLAALWEMAVATAG
jgi:thiamine kinase